VPPEHRIQRISSRALATDHSALDARRADPRLAIWREPDNPRYVLQAPDYVPPFEPTALAAVLSVNEMRQLAIDGMTMVVVTHEMGLAREAADSVVFIDEGLITESGPRKRRSARHITREREPSWRRLCEGTPLP
jgi:hypothetical protein